MQSRILRDLLVAPNNSAPQAATPSFFGQNPINFSSAQVMPQFCSPVEATSPSFLQLSTHVGMTPMPSPTSVASPHSLAQLLPAHSFPAHSLPAHSLLAHPLPASALPPFSTSQLPNDYQLRTTPDTQILELLNLVQMVQGKNLKAPQAPSSIQSPVSRMIHAESSSQTEAHAGPSLVERAVSPTAPFGIVSMEEEMLNLKKEMDQLQKMYDNDVKKFEWNQRQMSEGHQETVTKMSEAMKLLEDDFKKLSSADKKTIEDLMLAGSQKDVEIDALVQKNKQLETENKQMAQKNTYMKIQMTGMKCRKGLQILYFRTNIRALVEENYQLMDEKESIESEYEERNQTLLRVQSELADLTRKLQAQEEELQELRDFKIKAEVDKKEAQRQLEMTHSNVVTANLPLKKSESPAYNPGFEDDGYLHEETVYTEMSEEIAKMPKEEKFSEILEKQKDDSELYILNKKLIQEIENIQKRLDRAEIQLMHQGHYSQNELIQERLELIGQIMKFRKDFRTLRSENSDLKNDRFSMRSSLQKLQFFNDAKVAEVSNLQRQAKGFLNLTEHQQKLERCQRMLKIYEDHSEKILICNNGRFYWRRKQGQSGTSHQQPAAKRSRQ